MTSIMRAIIKFYRRYISPLKSRRVCKYYPSCSQYALDALDEWGAVGIFLALWRILRCNPFSKGGVDYVPKNKKRAERQKNNQN